MAVELYDEHEQSERVRSWIREYGMSLVMGLVLAFAGIFGFRYWQDQQTIQRSLAAEYFSVIQRELGNDQLDFAEEQFQAMREAVDSNAYTALAAMLMAGAYIEDGRLQPAADLYREILANKRAESLWSSTRLRLARVLQAQGELDEALALLDGEAPTGFQGAWAETRGDLLLAQGNRAEARAAFQEALDNLSGQGASRGLIQLKIDSTGPGVNGETS